jgi:hypothetical protein
MAIINKYVKLMGKNIHPHAFRHGCATNSVLTGLTCGACSRCWGILT